MATVKQCDRCQTQSELYGARNWGTLKIGFGANDDRDEITFDLCDACLKHMHKEITDRATKR